MKYQEVFPLPTEWLRDIDVSLARTVARWAEQEVMSKRLEHGEDYDNLLFPAIRKLFVDIGLQNLPWPEESGGCGMSTGDTALTLCAVQEQAGRADMGIAFLYANTFAIQSALGIEPHRDESLLQDLHALFCSGGQVAEGSLILPDYGDGSQDEDPGLFGLQYQVKLTAKGDDWVLNGENARPQCSGATAKIFGVICATEKGDPALLVVPTTASGLERGAPFKKTGLAASINADLAFRNVKVPKNYLVFDSIERYREMLGWYYLGCAAACVGACFASWEILKEWGETRVIKGKGQTFKENPLAAALMGEIGGRVGIARLLVYDLARILSKPDIYGSAGSSATFATATAVLRTVIRAAMDSINNAMELMGSAGYATEWNLERYWRDVKTVETLLGPETSAQIDMARHYFECQTL